MTPAHVFFIPTVFLLGLFVGGMLSTRLLRSDPAPDADSVVQAKPSVKTLAIAFIVFACIFAATHGYPQFGGAKAISAAAHGIPLLDQRPAFSSIAVFDRLEAIGPIGRGMYQQFTYSVDVIFPLSLLAFLFSLTRFVRQRVTSNKRLRQVLETSPFIWFATDMLENAIVFTLLLQFPARNDFLGSILGFVTVLKFSLLLLSIAGPAIVMVAFRKSEVQDSSMA